MTYKELQQLRYPIGEFKAPEHITSQLLNQWIETLERFPLRLEALVKFLTKKQLDTPYRPDGWTIRQVVHHISDSHHHSYIRFKWALTEDKPVIKPYQEGLWAELHDTKTAPIAMSLEHLKAVHYKLVYLLKGLSEAQWGRSFIHPESNSEVLLNLNVGIYVWHCNHHYAHIENALKQNGWI
ncbi:putative metal-dependent hydrolase [Sabulilitoribacter arenilitoris]|uniref:Metal-dependent hydrolase n=1 Tax=Wocania arenilitoris TaxID=2044858 RepID=A0AAE3ESH8_9FLAO|nr:putative metal-dependent hydrolase [Wocania arenilitoris]MCF7569295.1 putative metal-dependent hydrolase [Wocania arenilitoris]